MPRQGKNPLQTMAVVILGFALLDLILGAVQTRAWIAMIESHELGPDRLLTYGLQLAALIALGLVAYTAIAQSRHGRDRLASRLWWAVALVAGLACTDVLLGLASSMAGDDPTYYRLYRHKWFSVTVRLAHLGWIALLAIAAARAARRSVLSAGAVGLCVGGLALSILDRPFGELSVEKSLWLQYLMFTALPAAAMLIAAWLCRLAATANPSADLAPATGGIGDPSRWTDAADGLHLYRSALIWRLIITFSGYTLLIMAALGRSPGLARFLMWSLPLAALATGVVMLAGVIKFGTQPAESPGKTAAVFAAVTMAIALLLEFFGLTQVLTAIGADPADGYRKIREALETAQAVSPWAMALSFAGMLALLVSLRALATRLADTALARRALALIVWLVIIGGAVTSARLWMAGVRPRDASNGLMLALVVGIAALIALVAFVGLVRQIEERLRDTTGRIDVPTARLVED